MLGFKPVRKSKTSNLVNIQDVRIASPCPVEWSRMTGTDRVRHCSQCNLKVYDFSAMIPEEIEGLVAGRQGDRLCARIYRRSDGTMLTEDCPKGLRARMVRRASRAAGMAVAALMSLHAAAWQKVQPKECSPSPRAARHDSGLEVTVLDPQEALVPGAQVAMVRKGAGKKKKGTTGSEGRLLLQNLKAGDYVLSVNAKGFKVAERSVTLNEGRLTEVKVKLQIGEAASEVVVVGEPALVTGTISCRLPAASASVPQVMGGQRGPAPMRQ